MSGAGHAEISALSFEPPSINIASDSSSDTSIQIVSTVSSNHSSSDSTARARHDLESTALYSKSEFERETQRTPSPTSSRSGKMHSTIRKAELQKYNDVLAKSVEGGQLYLTQSGKQLQETPLGEFQGQYSSDIARQILPSSDSIESYDMLPNVVSVFSRVVDQKDSFLSSTSMKSSISNTDDLNNSSLLSSVDIELKSVHVDDAAASVDRSSDGGDVLESHAMDAKSRYRALLASGSMSSVERSSDDTYLRDIKLRVTRIESIIAREQRNSLGSDVFKSSSSSSASVNSITDANNVSGSYLF